MDKAKRMILVDPEASAKYSVSSATRSEMFRNPIRTQLNQLDSEMLQTINNESLSDAGKVEQYYQSLMRYRSLTDNVKARAAIPLSRGTTVTKNETNTLSHQRAPQPSTLGFKTPDKMTKDQRATNSTVAKTTSTPRRKRSLERTPEDQPRRNQRRRKAPKRLLQNGGSLLNWIAY